MKIDTEKSKIYSFRNPTSDLYTCGMLYTGKRGYFSDYPDFADCEEDILIGVNVIAEAELVYYPFKKKSGAVVADSFKYFCPEEYAVKKLKRQSFADTERLTSCHSKSATR